MINITRGHLSIYQNALGEKSKTNVIVSDFPQMDCTTMGPLLIMGLTSLLPIKNYTAQLLEPNKASRLHYMMANLEVSRQKVK